MIVVWALGSEGFRVLGLFRVLGFLGFRVLLGVLV